MIIFDLECSNGHSFEGWFEDGNAFKAQQLQGLITCPHCNSSHVVQVPSTFSVKASLPKTTQFNKQQTAIINTVNEITSKITDFVENNFENVGADFAKEALKMHYGVTKQKNIRGVTTDAENKLLEQEGIGSLQLPVQIKN